MAWRTGGLADWVDGWSMTPELRTLGEEAWAALGVCGFSDK